MNVVNIARQIQRCRGSGQMYSVTERHQSPDGRERRERWEEIGSWGVGKDRVQSSGPHRTKIAKTNSAKPLKYRNLGCADAAPFSHNIRQRGLVRYDDEARHFTGNRLVDRIPPMNQMLGAFICWLMYSACCGATATMVNVGFAVPGVVRTLPSEINRFLTKRKMGRLRNLEQLRGPQADRQRKLLIGRA